MSACLPMSLYVYVSLRPSLLPPPSPPALSLSRTVLIPTSPSLSPFTYTALIHHLLIQDLLPCLDRCHPRKNVVLRVFDRARGPVGTCRSCCHVECLYVIHTHCQCVKRTHTRHVLHKCKILNLQSNKHSRTAEQLTNRVTTVAGVSTPTLRVDLH